MSDENFLSRWSRKKTEAKALEQPLVEPPAAQSLPLEPVDEATPPPPLPPIESLTSESDFVPFMQAEVDPGLKRRAFKKLIEDPRYNIMDGLDVYIDDYSKPDPLPQGWLEKMNQVKHLGIFKPPEEEADSAPAPEAAQLQKPMPEQPHAGALEASPPDTSAAEILPSGVGKTGVAGEGL